MCNMLHSRQQKQNNWIEYECEIRECGNVCSCTWCVRNEISYQMKNDDQKKQNEVRITNEWMNKKKKNRNVVILILYSYLCVKVNCSSVGKPCAHHLTYTHKTNHRFVEKLNWNYTHCMSKGKSNSLTKISIPLNVCCLGLGWKQSGKKNEYCTHTHNQWL